MINKQTRSLEDAVSRIESGSVLLIGGFGDIGVPLELVAALSERPICKLTVVSNNAGTGDLGLSLLFKRRQVSKVIASFPSQAGADHFFEAYAEGGVEVELVPQGTLAERLRAGGSGVAGFFTPTGYGTELTQDKETRVIGGRGHVYEEAIRGDYALVAAQMADAYGNLRYRLASRNFNPLMAMAGKHTIAQVRQIVPVGAIDPDDVHTPSVFVNQIVEIVQ
jgi:3-oxoadipate CoA-transferase alpha subunit